MSKKYFNKKFVFSFIISFTFSTFALDYTDVSSTLADTFYNLTGENEGTTSFRSLLIPSGGRAESLGSAYTGLANDISFFDYNPAGSCLLEQSEFAIFHNSWIADSSMETLSYATRKNNLGYGAKLNCFYVPFTEYDVFGNRVASSYYSETTATLNISYNFHAGYRFKGIALGSNLKTSWRSIPDYTDNSGSLISGSGLEQSGLAVMGDMGIMTSFNLFKHYTSRDANVRLGLSAMNMGVAFTGFKSEDGIKLDDPLCSTIGVGLSYKPTKPLTFTTEFRKPINLFDISEDQAITVGLGSEVQVTDFFAFLGGFQLKGGNPRFSIGSEFTLTKIIMNVNYTLDLTSSLNPVNHISLSAKIKLSDRGLSARQRELDGMYRQGLEYFSQGNFYEAINTWSDLLTKDPYFEPAKEAILNALDYEELLNKYDL